MSRMRIGWTAAAAAAAAAAADSLQARPIWHRTGRVLRQCCHRDDVGISRWDDPQHAA